MSEPMKAWQCIGCGKIDGYQPCIGVCQDVPVKLVYAAELEEAQARVDALEAVLRQIVATTPRNSEWERSYRALQERARLALGAKAA
jgi:hypothetical protein